MNRFFTFAVLGMSLLSSCSHSDKNPLPLYLAPESPLDAPGEAAARKAEFYRRAKDGLFANGTKVSVNQGKAFFFATNPDIDGGEKGKMMKASEVEIVTCEGMYYYVKTADGDGGYLRESDLVDPAASMGMMGFGLNPFSPFANAPAGDGALPLATGELSLFPESPSANAATVTTNANGRVVTMVSKKTDAGQEFREKNALQTSPAQPDNKPKPPPVCDDMEIPDLPDSAAERE